MDSNRVGCGQKFRVWIASCAEWWPTGWSDAPPSATALEQLDAQVYAAEDAIVLIEGFNRCMLADRGPLWAVAVPVSVRYEGDAQPGLPVRGFVFADGAAAHGDDAEDVESGR